MGCDMSKLKEKEKAHDAKVKADREKKKEEHHAKHHPEEAAKKEEAKAEKEAKAEVQKEAAEEKKAEAEVREDHHEIGEPREAAAQEQQEEAAVDRAVDAPAVAATPTASEHEAAAQAPVEEEATSAPAAVSAGEAAAAPAATAAAPAAAEGEEPAVMVLKRRPQKTPGGAAPGTPRAPISAGEPRGNYDDYAPRDENGQVIVRPEDAAQQGGAVNNGQLIEREEPSWHVARPPPPTSGWVLLRQVRMVMQMRKLTAI